MDDRVIEAQSLRNRLYGPEGLSLQEMRRYEEFTAELKSDFTPELIDYCDLAMDEVCAENCVDCPYWDGCEHVTAMVLPELLNGLVQYVEGDLDEASDAFGDEESVKELQEWVDVVYAVIARLKGEQYEERDDHPL